MGIFSSDKQWSNQARITARRQHQRTARKYRNEKQARRANRRHAIEHPVSHAWSMFRTRNQA